MKSLSFRTKVILLAVVPVLVVSTVITALAIYKMHQLGEVNSREISNKIFELRKNELRNYTDLAVTAIKHVYVTSVPDNQDVAQQMARRVLRDMKYGDNGYFFTLDYDGNIITHSAQPYLEGQNLWHLQDINNDYFVRSLVRNAKNNVGGYTEYVWEKPSVNQQVDKLSFSTGLNKWRWIVATGLYMDDIQHSVNGIQRNIDENTHYTIVLTVGISLFFTALVAFLAMRFTVSQGRFANKKLQQLSRTCVQEREVEREVLANNLKQEVLSPLKPVINLLKRTANTEDLKSSTKSKLLSVVAELDKAQGCVRELADRLHPEILVKEGIYPAIEELAEGLSQDSGIKIDIKTLNRMERPSLNIETACYRIVCEALMNIIRHSQASEASIRFRQSRNMLSLTIQDNGAGFDLHENFIHERGVGLADMQLQVELLNGTFTVFSSKGTGTMIKLAIPLLTSPEINIPVTPRNISL